LTKKRKFFLKKSDKKVPSAFLSFFKKFQEKIFQKKIELIFFFATNLFLHKKFLSPFFLIFKKGSFWFWMNLFFSPLIWNNWRSIRDTKWGERKYYFCWKKTLHKLISSEKLGRSESYMKYDMRRVLFFQFFLSGAFW